MLATSVATTALAMVGSPPPGASLSAEAMAEITRKITRDVARNVFGRLPALVALSRPEYAHSLYEAIGPEAKAITEAALREKHLLKPDERLTQATWKRFIHTKKTADSLHNLQTAERTFLQNALNTPDLMHQPFEMYFLAPEHTD